MKFHFFKQTNKKLRVSVHSYIHYNVFQMDLQGSTLVGKHLLLHMDLSWYKIHSLESPSDGGGSSKAHKSQFLGGAGD